MKIRYEIEAEPEEVRKLLGLPDMQPIYDAVTNKIKEGDTEVISQVTKGFLDANLKSIGLLQKAVSGLGILSSAEKSSSKKTSESKDK